MKGFRTYYTYSLINTDIPKLLEYNTGYLNNKYTGIFEILGYDKERDLIAIYKPIVGNIEAIEIPYNYYKEHCKVLMTFNLYLN